MKNEKICFADLHGGKINMKCYRCDEELISRSCKLFCPNCGYSLDCNDL